MKIKNWIWLFVLTIWMSCISWNVSAQVPVEISQEKVIISGTQYYIHQVRKGQTSYSISRAYGISTQDLTTENPQAVYGIKEGQILRIPIKHGDANAAAASKANKAKRDDSKFIYHPLKPGETVYSLSRAYGVSENEIVQSNPGIDINKLSVGTEIAVPRRDFMTQKQKFVDQDQRYIYHQVKNGETLSSIADKYGVSVRVLRRENKNLRFPKVGDYIRVPSSALAEPEPEPVVVDTVPEVIEEEVVKYERPVAYTPVKDLEGSMDVAVLLPFYLSENSRRFSIDSLKSQKGKMQYKATRKPDEYIIPESLDFIEMYDGILLAVDTLRSLGLDINLHTYDIKGDTIGVTRLINSGKLAEMDLIIGPVYSHNLSIVSRYAKEHGIPVVSPVELMSNSVLSGNPTLFMSFSSIEVIQNALARQVSQDNRSNIVFVHTDSTGSDMDVKRLKELIFSELNKKMPYEDIRFRELIFYSRSTFSNDSINRISHSLSENSNNIVIIATEDAPVVSAVVTTIHGLSKRYNVRIYGYPSVVYNERLDPRLFFDLDMLVFSPAWIDYNEDNVRQFNLNYFRKFFTMPLETSFAWRGFDIAYYFISGLAMRGKEFIEHPETHHPELLQNQFDFERKSMRDGFENQNLFRIRYSKNYEVKKEE
jgi:LysM repeat protein